MNVDIPHSPYDRIHSPMSTERAIAAERTDAKARRRSTCQCDAGELTELPIIDPSMSARILDRPSPSIRNLGGSHRPTDGGILATDLTRIVAAC